MKTQLFNQHLNALRVRELRNEVLASNLANADTPNYKARDVDFSTALQDAQQGKVRLVRTNPMHADSGSSNRFVAGIELREATQASLDGNTVEADVEQAALAENTVQYRAALTFLNGQIRTLQLAIKGTD
jgi:flagellar basal-body rod protein FlgB